MARAIVPGFSPRFGGLPDIFDDQANGFGARFLINLFGPDVPFGFMSDIFEVHFLDTDTAFQMDNKIKEAARARAAELGITNAATMRVISFLPPRPL